MTDRISVIVTTYNREDALDAVLRSLARQTDRDFEVLVADDGSGPGTAARIENWKNKIGIPLHHVWHEDKGFRAAAIRNRAILAATGLYCIFLDGDCLARPDFVAAHRRLAEQGWFVTGNRILLSPGLTADVLRQGLEAERWAFPTWIRWRWRRGVNRVLPLLHAALGPFRKLQSRTWQGARSCNLGIWRADLVRVDGYDAEYDGWGREDSDLLVRLLRAGIRRKSGNFATGVIHLWHREADRAYLPDNDARLDAVLAGDRWRARKGLSVLSPVERISA